MKRDGHCVKRAEIAASTSRGAARSDARTGHGWVVGCIAVALAALQVVDAGHLQYSRQYSAVRRSVLAVLAGVHWYSTCGHTGSETHRPVRTHKQQPLRSPSVP